MFYRIISYFNMKKNNRPVFSEKYISGYKKLWIDEIRDYSP